MSQPVLLLVAGPDGAGKSTFVERLLQPRTHLPFVNADRIAAEHWPGDELQHAYEASRLAAQERDGMIADARSFISETVFSHPSKLDLIADAQQNGYLVNLHVIMLPTDTAVARVGYRAAHGGHEVPEQKIRERYERLWGLLADARTRADSTRFYDNSRAASPFRLVAEYVAGVPIGAPRWPAWTPTPALA